jgi:mycofactocin precursor
MPADTATALASSDLETPAEGAVATLVPPPLAPAPEPPAADGLVEEELLVEDVSIDGMCGVY